MQGLLRAATVIVRLALAVKRRWAKRMKWKVVDLKGEAGRGAAARGDVGTLAVTLDLVNKTIPPAKGARSSV